MSCNLRSTPSAGLAGRWEFFERRLRPVIGQTYPLAQAAAAHRAIEERRTTGKTLLLP